jgi:NADPH:quinone reductase-like Zn-dependent oxidoreductase
MGVTHCIDYRKEDFEDAVRRITGRCGVDVVLDSLGGASFRKSYRCLAPLGRLLCFGVSSLAPSHTRRLAAVLLGLARMPRFGPTRLMNENRGVLGVNLGRLWDHPLLPIALREILQLTDEGTLTPVVDRTFPLAEAAAAHEYLQQRRNFGKVLLAP